ncbi:MAG: DedA family protein [Gammaproteobacteria bacterium]|nr:DedA family protein [Gammaproteobacteria bacterium]
MDLETLIANYGYLAILVGTLFQGESIMILGGFFASLSYLELPWVFTCGFLGTYTSETFFYILGKTKGADFIERKPQWKQKSRRVFELLHKHKYLLILGHRFIYGMRSITPFAIGASGINTITFATLNAIGSALWTTIIGTAGYFFGHTLERYLEEIDRYEHWVLLAIFCIIFAIWAISYYLSKYITASK